MYIAVHGAVHSNFKNKSYRDLGPGFHVCSPAGCYLELHWLGEVRPHGHFEVDGNFTAKLVYDPTCCGHVNRALGTAKGTGRTETITT